MKILIKNIDNFLLKVYIIKNTIYHLVKTDDKY